MGGNLMRTVTFADDKLVAAINQNVIPVWHNQNPDAANNGADSQPKPSQQQIDAYPLGGGAGNMRAYFCDPDGSIVHYLQGYWPPEHFLTEMDFAQEQFIAVAASRRSGSTRNTVATGLDKRIAEMNKHQSELQKLHPAEFSKPIRLSTVRKEHAAVGLKVASYSIGKTNAGQDVGSILSTIVQQNLFRGVIV